jgi:uncharacterized integral membrane protein
MKPRTVLYVILLLIIVVFVLANWSLLASPAELSLLVTTIRAPGGVVGLLIAAVILLVDWSTHALSRRAWERERRQLTQEIERVRAQAEDAENSRLRALQDMVDRESGKIRAQLDRLLELQEASVTHTPPHSP